MLPNGTDYLAYGPLGASIFVLLVAVGVLFRVLLWAREIMEMVLGRIQDNTAALVRLAERLHGGEGEDQ